MGRNPLLLEQILARSPVNKKIFFFFKIFIDLRVCYRASCTSGRTNINM
jgi:hypothetical protein